MFLVTLIINTKIHPNSIKMLTILCTKSLHFKKQFNKAKDIQLLYDRKIP